jgi:hypothetical protein
VRAEITAGTAKCQSIVHRPRKRGSKAERNPPDISLNTPVGEGATELIDLLIDGHPDYEPRYCDREQLAEALKSLGSREQTIFTARWLSDDPVPFPKLASQFQISAERCRQVGNEAFAAVAARMKTPNPVFARQITSDAFSNHGHSLTHSVFAWPDSDYPVQFFGGPKSRGVRK